MNPIKKNYSHGFWCLFCTYSYKEIATGNWLSPLQLPNKHIKHSFRVYSNKWSPPEVCWLRFLTLTSSSLLRAATFIQSLSLSQIQFYILTRVQEVDFIKTEQLEVIQQEKIDRALFMHCRINKHLLLYKYCFLLLTLSVYFSQFLFL